MLNIINFAQPFTGNFIVDIIVWLVSITSSVAVGIILFTLLLKLITTPFDVFSKISMRKNAIKMEEMRPELEKLQKQYANDKRLYQQKMMALYKKNGYSMFGACLPTILTLVIFIVAITGFNAYSRYQNLSYFYNMSNAYNSVIYDGVELDESANGYIYKDENGAVKIKIEDFVNKDTLTIENNNENVTVYIDEGEVANTSSKFVEIRTENGYVKAKYTYAIKEDGTFDVAPKVEYSAYETNLLTNTTLKNNEGKTYAEVKAAGEATEDTTDDITADKFILDLCSDASAASYREQNSGFLWVSNIWAADVPWAHPIESNWEKFKSTHGYNNNDTQTITDTDYNNLIAKLDAEKTAPNGYLVLAILTIATAIGTQFVMKKTQKAQLELQTVDGQGATTQKVMMWVMPIMMAVFAFIYTAAFSIYMVISSVITIASTLGINWIVDKKYGKKKKTDGEKEIVRGRVRDEEPEPVKEKKPKKEKKVKKEKNEDAPAGDFISGSGDKPVKHIRGRLK